MSTINWSSQNPLFIIYYFSQCLHQEATHLSLHEQQFYNAHKQQGWFKQKYYPISMISQQNQRNLYSKTAQKQFLEQFQKKDYDKLYLTINDYKQLGRCQFEQGEQGQLDQNKHVSILTLYLNDNVKIQGPPLHGIQKDTSTVFIPDLPKQIFRFDLYEVVAGTEGFTNLIISQPQRKLDFKRMVWIEYQNQQKANEALLKLKDTQIKSKKLQFIKACKRISKAKMVTNYPESRVQQDLASAVAIASKLDYEAKIYQNNTLYEYKYFKNPRNKLQLFLTYLRKVHFFEYFESKFYDSFRTLTIKSGMTIILVEPKTRDEVEIDQLIKLDAKNQIVKQSGSQVFRKRQLEDIKIFSELLKTRLHQIHQFNPLIDQNPKYWKCHQCHKKFLTMDHLLKHTISRHESEIEDVIEQATIKIYTKNEEEWEKNRPQREKKQEKATKRRRIRFLRDFDDPEEQQDEQIRLRLKPMSVTKKLINFMDI